MTAPTIIGSTGRQVVDFGDSGVIPAPAHDPGSGDNPVWTLTAGDLSSTPGVITWTIDQNTGNIEYEINRLSSDPDEQALNTNGPHGITRRITTTEGFDEEGFDFCVQIGDRTIRYLSVAFRLFRTKTCATVGVETGKDPSERKTQKYTIL